jgi:hypothetical protein
LVYKEEIFEEEIKMKKLVFLMFVFCCSGCFKIDIGQKEVYEKYPIYKTANKPVLKDIPSRLLVPYKQPSGYVDHALKDGVLTKEEIEEFKRLLSEAMVNEEGGRVVFRDNFDALIKWGLKNKSTVDSYNEYAEKMNKRIK